VECETFAVVNQFYRKKRSLAVKPFISYKWSGKGCRNCPVKWSSSLLV